jgi:hypothetical protein
MTATTDQAGTAAPLEMNPEIRARWVAALRSGEYRQGDGHLRMGDRLCCLGVLCELAVEDGVVNGVQLSDGLWEYNGSAGWLPPAVVDWAARVACCPGCGFDQGEHIPGCPLIGGGAS